VSRLRGDLETLVDKTPLLDDLRHVDRKIDPS
jgi:hypothetical protein